MKWIRIYHRDLDNELPQDLGADAHMQKLYVNTRKYGCMEAVYCNGHFRTNYATTIEDVTHWMLLPEAPAQ